MSLKLNVKIKKLTDKAIIPTYGTQFSAGCDLYSTEKITVFPHETAVIHTGVALEIPPSYVGLIYARSGLATKKGLAPANKVGVIDSDYRGEIMVALHNHSAFEWTVDEGERVAQLIFTPVYVADFEEVESLSDTTRGAGGFGSTGNK